MIPPPVGKDKENATANLLLEPLGNQSMQASGACSHIAGLHSDEDPQ